MTGLTQLVELARSRARDRPEAVAYGFVRGRAASLECLSYGELDRRARATAAFLQERAEPGDRALLLFQPGLELLAAFVGCLYAGVVAVPAYPVRRKRSLERLRAVVVDAAPRLALTSTGHAERSARRLADDPVLPELACHDLGAALATPPERWREHAPAPDDLAFLQYTSGSTSEPKGVMLSHRNLLTELAEVAAGHAYGPDSTMVSWLPTFHDMGLIYGVLQPLFHGFPGYLLAPEAFVRDPASWLHALTRLRGTHAAAPDFAYDLCVRAVDEDGARGLDLSAWRVAVDGAEPIRHSVVDAFVERFGRHGFSRRAFSPSYGLAEATLKVTSVAEAHEPRFLSVRTAELERGVVAIAGAGTDAGRWLAGCGVPGPRTELRIVDPETRRPAAANRVGEVWVRGAAVARGYWRRPDATEETFGATLATGEGEPGPWLRTGDLAFLHEGELFLTGRLKDLVIVRGRNLYPQDVEVTVQAVSRRLRPGRGAVFGVASEGSEELVVTQELEPRVTADEAEELLGEVRRAVTEEHEVEVAAVALLRFGALPVTTSGKVRRRAAREAFLAGELKAAVAWRRPALEAPRTEEPAEPGLATEPGALGWLRPRVARHLGVPADALPDDEPLAAHGMGSLAALRLAAEIEERLGRRFDATLLYRYPTLTDLARFLARRDAGPEEAEPSSTAASGTRYGRERGSEGAAEAIAVVGLGCRFPGSPDPEGFWRLLDEGHDGTGEVPAERHELRAFLDSPAGRELPRRGGFLGHVDRFDPAFFQLSPSEADLLDPQHRLLLEVAWEALESVGRPPDDWRGGAAGVFVGLSSSDYRELLGAAPDGTGVLEPHAATGNAHTMAANRLSYLFDWRGPSLAVDTACSSSLVAVHQACEALRRGECEMALAAGVNVILAPQLTASFHRAGMLSPDGRSKAFDHRADGYGRGEGCGVVVLETLADARRHGDRVLAVIRGSAVAQDGRSNGLTAPNPEAQVAVVSAALRRAGVRPEEVSCVEAHGTGTPLGDPMELQALQAVLRPGARSGEGATPCAVGAVKTNLGHLEAAAGIAGLIKTVLALGHRRLPANLHFEAPNPLLGDAAHGFTFPTSSSPWEMPPGGRRVAGVSSFGFGGTLAHVVLEEAPPSRPAQQREAATRAGGTEAHLLCLSAHTGEALREAARRWRDLLRRPAAPSAADLAHASQRGRAHLRERLAVVGRTSDELAAALDAFVADPAAPVPEEGPFRAAGRRGHDVEVPAAPVPRAGAGEGELRTLAERWAEGAEVDWACLHDGAPVPRLDLPLYPFQRQRCWYAPELAEVAGASPEAPAAEPGEPGEPVDVLNRLRAIVAPLLRVEPAALDPRAPFLEMGADSIVMVRALRAVEESFGVRVPVRQLFEATPTLHALAGFLASRRPAAAPAPAAPTSAAGKPWPDDGLAGLVRRQSEALELLARRQREIEERLAGGAPADVLLPPGAGDEETAVPSPLPPWRIQGAASGSTDGLGEGQRRHLEVLTARYTARTAGSKRAAEGFRPRLADNRASAGFRFSTKEMLYPLLGDRAAGSRVWDVDGNEYVDLTMGFGAYLFGHAPPFVTAALRDEMARGFALGPQSRLAGEVADLVAELTGLDRVAFCNTGTEAVMTALRLARTVTGRTRVAVFEGSYHGHSDGVLGVARRAGRRLRAVPAAPGVPPGAVADLLPLPYGTDASLEVLRAEAPRLAAILVEPVQSRHPDLQPAEFLREVAVVAREAGAALVFDEMITGFRIAPGGAQEHFGVRADLATYGKIAGGGMPIGLVAGSRRFLDALDGGHWSYGDDSWPAAETTFFAGTFNKHPLALAASRAVLARIRDDGGRLHRELDERTGRLTGALDALFESRGAPLRTARFGSLFRFVHAGNQDPFLYHLLERGVFIWEGRNCFLSTVHSKEDLDRIVAAAEGALGELSAAGFYARPPERRPEELAEIPLTTAQRQLCLLARLGPEASAAYNEGVVLAFAEPVEAGRVERALAALAARHEALRTVIDAERGRQRVAPSAPTLLAVREAASPAEREAALAEVFAEPFPLVGGGGRPPFRAVLLRAPGAPDLLALVGHHALVDGASLGILVRDLGALYGADGEGSPADAPAPSFRGYLARRAARRDELDRQAEAWLGHLAPAPPPLELPGDRPRPPLRSFRGTAVDAVLDPAVAAALGRRAAALGATPFMALLTAWTLLLHRVSGQDDLLVGVPASGRADDEDAGVVGFAAHLLPIRSRLAPGVTLAGHLARVRNEVLAAFERQDVPFAEVLERLELPFDPARPPLVASTFNLDRDEAPGELFPGAEPLAPLMAFTKFDLSLNVTRLGAEHRLRLEAARDLFDPTTARHLLDRYRALVAALVEHPERPAADAPLLSRAERHLVLVERNDAPGPPPPREDLVAWFAERVRRHPERVALRHGESCLSYRSLDGRSARLAARLLRDGGRRSGGLRSPHEHSERSVGVSLDAGLDLPVALLAVLRAGAFYVPLDPALPPDRLAAMVRGTGLRRVIAGRGHRELWRDLGGELGLDVVEVGGLETAEAGGAAAAPAVPIHPQALAYVLHTSGSTGRPKGVAVPHGALARFLAAVAERPGFPEEATLLALTPLSFDIAGLELYLPLVRGGTVAILDPEARGDARALERALDDARAQIVQATPATWRLLLAAGWPGRPGLTLLCGGEALPDDLARRLEARGAELWNLYGPTETTIWSSTRRVATAERPVDLGLPLTGTRLYTVGPDLRPVPPGTSGELVIGGAGVTRGYVGDPARTAVSFCPDPFARDGARLYRTGDRVRLLTDGRLAFLGRLDHQVKVEGHRIELDEVSAALEGLPEVAAAAVLAETDGAGSSHLAAWLVPAPGARPEVPALRRALTGRLPAYMVPARFRLVDALPLTPNGKLDRRALAALAGESAALGTEEAAPATETEAALAALWAEVLGRESVGVEDNFFDLGGTSSRLARVHVRAEAALGRSFPFVDCIRFPTVRSLAGHLSGASDAAGDVLTEAYRRARLRRLRLDLLAPAPGVQTTPQAPPAAGPVSP